MIELICKNDSNVYNAFHIIKAFYPLEEIRTQVDEKASFFLRMNRGGELFFEDGAEDILKEEHFCRLYEALCGQCKKELPWGVLTGVRPTKLAMMSLDQGETSDEYIRRMYARYRVSKKKAALCRAIAKREKQILSRADVKNGYSLYVGIPFCPSICSYCSFSSGEISRWEDSVDRYLDTLVREICFLAANAKNHPLNSIYVGGGTPTTLNPERLERLLCAIETQFDFSKLAEYTVEAGRPDSITRAKLEVLKRHHVSRISINPQSMQDKTLLAVGRGHTSKDTVEAYRLARGLGFDNINMDLIAGLPGETLNDFRDTLRQIEALEPDNLTVHTLAIKRASQLTKEDLRRSHDTENMIEEAAVSAKKMRLYPYYLYRQKDMSGNFENVGYSKVDKEGLYNILIMEELQTILAAGAGASTKIILNKPILRTNGKRTKTVKIMRVENVKAIDAYMNRIDEMIARKEEWLWR